MTKRHPYIETYLAAGSHKRLPLVREVVREGPQQQEVGVSKDHDVVGALHLPRGVQPKELISLKEMLQKTSILRIKSTTIATMTVTH